MPNKDIVPALFEGHKIRTAKNANGEVAYCFSDILAVASDTSNPRHEMANVKSALQREGIQLSQIMEQFKFRASNGKLYTMWGGTRKQILRALQEVHTRKAAIVKNWLAELAEERLEEIENPDKGADNAIEGYRKQGKSDRWIQERFKGKVKFASMTDALKRHGAENYAVLIDVQHRHAFDLSVKAHKALKGIEEKGSLRDGMNEWELFVQEAADTASKWLLDEQKAKGQSDCKKSMADGGDLAATLRASMERKLGREIIDNVDYRQITA